MRWKVSVVGRLEHIQDALKRRWQRADKTPVQSKGVWLWACVRLQGYATEEVPLGVN